MEIIGIVLRAAKQGDHNKILTVLTANGPESIIAYGATRATSDLSAVCQPFCYAVFQLKRSKGNLLAIHSYDIIESFYNLRLDLEKLEIAADLCRLTSQTSFPDTDCEGTLKLLLNTLFVLQKHSDVSVIKPFFLLRYICVNGFTPESGELAKLSPQSKLAVRHAIFSPATRLYNAKIAPNVLAEVSKFAEGLVQSHLF